MNEDDFVEPDPRDPVTKIRELYESPHYPLSRDRIQRAISILLEEIELDISSPCRDCSQDLTKDEIDELEELREKLEMDLVDVMMSIGDRGN